MAQKSKTNIPDALRFWETLPDSAHVRLPTVESLFGISSATVWRRVAAGTLPKPIKFSERVTTWRVADLRAVLNAKAAQP
jgi:predicted DNA-binding transcriptional regulator AlpA